MSWFRGSCRKAGLALSSVLALVLTEATFSGAIDSAQAEPPNTVTTIPEAAPNATGEVALTNVSGSSTATIKGFTNPQIVEFSPSGKLLVADSDRREAFSFGYSSGRYTLERTWKIPPEIPEPIGIHEYGESALIVFERHRRVAIVNPDSSFEGLVLAEDSTTGINRSTFLSKDQFLAVSSNPNSSTPKLFLFDVPTKSWTPLAIADDTLAPVFPPNAVAGSGENIILWRIGNGTTRYGSIQRGTFTASSVVLAVEPTLLVSDEAGGIYNATFNGSLRHTPREGTSRELFQFFPPPTDMAFHKASGQFAFAYNMPKSTAWPDAFNKWYPLQDPFNWKMFALLTIGGAILGIGWLFTARLTLAPLSQHKEAAGEHPFAPLRWTLIAIIVSTIGLTLALCGHNELLKSGELKSWLPSYLLGALLVGAATEMYRRWYPSREEPLSARAMLFGDTPRFNVSMLAPFLGILILIGLILCLGTSTSYRGLREGAFCAALLLASCVCVADLFQARSQLKRCIAQEWWRACVPLLIGSVTLFYRLLDLPAFCHPDFTFNSFAAQMFLEGRISGAWSWGEVPAPIIGTFPEMIGLILAGPTPLGFRLGSALFNLTGILAIYLLGRTYRNARVGFWAAILLAGNIPFMHFGRLPSNGFATTTALWALTLFALAIRYQRISLWLSLGIVSGFSFYLWPVARVGMTAVACVYLLILIRYPLSQLKKWHLPAAALLGFSIMVAPLIPLWIKFPYLFMPRANESLVAFSWGSSFFDRLSHHPLFALLATSVGWIFNQTDASSQGTVSPGFNSIEAVLFACGFVVALIEGISLNVLLLALFMITTVVCGALADGTPWYTRLLPTAPIVAILAARAIEGLHNLSAPCGRKTYRAVFAVLSISLVWISPVHNFKLYERYETGKVSRYPWHPTLAIARHIHEMGPQYTYVLLARGEPNLRIEPAASFGTMLPYIMKFNIKEVYELSAELELSRDRPTAFIVQLARETKDIPEIIASYPGAKIEPIHDVNGTCVAKLVIINSPEGNTHR